MDVSIARMPEATADLIFWIALACCAVAQIAIIRSILLVTPSASTTAGTTPRSGRFAEIAWAILPAAMLGVVFWATWRAMHTHIFGSHHSALIVS